MIIDRGRGEIKFEDGTVTGGNYILDKRPKDMFKLTFYPDRLSIPLGRGVVDFKDENEKYAVRDIGDVSITLKDSNMMIVCDVILEGEF